MDLFKALTPYFDVNSINDYNRYGHVNPAYAALYEATGKPLMLTEFSFSGFPHPGYKSALFVDVYTQENRGRGYHKYVRQAARTPFMVGMHWFMWMDYTQQDRAMGGYLPDKNVGLVSSDETVDPRGTRGLGQAHQRLSDCNPSERPLDAVARTAATTSHTATLRAHGGRSYLGMAARAGDQAHQCQGIIGGCSGHSHLLRFLGCAVFVPRGGHCRFPPGVCVSRIAMGEGTIYPSISALRDPPIPV